MVRAIASAYRDAYSGLSKEVWVLSAALFVNRCGSMVLAFMTLYLTAKLGFSIIQAGAIFSVYGVGSIVGSYVGGRLIKPLGAIRVQIIGLALAGPLYFVVPLFSTWSGVAASVFLVSLCAEAIRPANNVAITQFTSAELQTRAFGLQRMALNLGYSVGPAVGGVLAEVDFFWLFAVDGVSTIGGALFLFGYFGFRKYAKGDAAAQQQKQAEKNHRGGSPLRDPQFVVFLLLMLGVSLVFFQFHATYPVYLTHHFQMTKPQIGLLFSVNTIIIVVFEMLLVNYVRRFSLLRTVGWGSLCACLGFGILPFGVAIWFAVLSMAIITLGEMFMFPVATGFVAQRGAHRDTGMYMSWYAMTYSFSSVVAPLLGSLIYEYDHDLVWYLSIGIGFLTLAGFYVLSAKTRDRPISGSP